MSVRIQDFNFTTKVNRASPGLDLPPPPPPPPPPSPQGPLVAGDSVTEVGWAGDAVHASGLGLPTPTGSPAGADILF